ncbi:MAG: formate/nitrite transporter family protein [Firmicutes bacterium]|nr:formate/nitrite transporter family protein [Bacillota bacterium]
MKTFKVFVSAIFAGICISFGGTAFILSGNKIAGALFFVIGLFVICTYGAHLFTGKVCYSLEQKPSFIGTLVLIWVGNFVGAFIFATGLKCTRLEMDTSFIEAKVNDGYLSLFILGILCNFLIFIAVDGFANNPHELGKYLSLFFGVSVFVLCGFEHSVADMFYFSLYGWSCKAFIAELFITAGNVVGGLLGYIGFRKAVQALK